MNREPRATFISAVILPQMEPVVVACDPTIQNFSCTPGQGSGAAGTFAMPGYILSWEGLPGRVGSHVYIREDWPLVTSEHFPGWVLTYLPQVQL